MHVDYSGTWDICSNVNFESYVSSTPLKIKIHADVGVVWQTLKPHKAIKQNGDFLTIRTITEVTEVTKGTDNRFCQVQIYSHRAGRKGLEAETGWSHWIEGDELHLVQDCSFCSGGPSKPT
uniref:Uncharacterized protein n=1 Tax=Mola mola TaxID=94237 RepID=A0A3Q3WYA6_MOLML